jgi:hypothetical protein
MAELPREPPQPCHGLDLSLAPLRNQHPRPSNRMAPSAPPLCAMVRDTASAVSSNWVWQWQLQGFQRPRCLSRFRHLQHSPRDPWARPQQQQLRSATFRCLLAHRKSSPSHLHRARSKPDQMSPPVRFGPQTLLLQRSASNTSTIDPQSHVDKTIPSPCRSPPWTRSKRSAPFWTTPLSCAAPRVPDRFRSDPCPS